MAPGTEGTRNVDILRPGDILHQLDGNNTPVRIFSKCCCKSCRCVIAALEGP